MLYCSVCVLIIRSGEVLLTLKSTAQLVLINCDSAQAIHEYRLTFFRIESVAIYLKLHFYHYLHSFFSKSLVWQKLNSVVLLLRYFTLLMHNLHDATKEVAWYLFIVHMQMIKG